MENYYEILGVAKDAGQSEIKKKFRELSKTHHPDKGGDEEMFKKINEAYSVLSDPQKKAEYDNPAKRTFNGYGFNMQDIYEEVFGNTSRSESYKINPHVSFRMEVTLEEVFNGVSKNLKYNTYTVCDSCNGEGGHDPKSCPTCNGMGYQQQRRGPLMMRQTCQACGGEGKTYQRKCEPCHSFGYIRQTRDINFNIPPSVINGETITYSNYGNEVKKNLFGDLNIMISTKKHETFARPTDAPFDLVYELELYYHDMLLGCEKIIPTISGTNVKINIPELTNNGKILRLKGQALKKRQNGIGILNERGDMHVIVRLKTFEHLTDRQKELLNELKKETENV